MTSNNQIEAIKSLINTSEQQTKLLKAELKRLEELTPKLTVRFSARNTYVFKTDYVKCYPGGTIDLSTLNHTQNREELLNILFGSNTNNNVYKAIYDNLGFSIAGGYQALRLLRDIYHIANNAAEKERIKVVYDKVLAKNMYVVNFKDCGNNLTENIIAELKRFYDIIKHNVSGDPIEDINALSYLVKNKLAYIEVYDNVLVHVNKWLSADYACMYSIE